MLTREMLLNAAKEAKQNKSGLFITLENKEIKFYTNEKCCSQDFLKKYNLDYDKNLIAGLNPEAILKYDYVVYKGDLNVNAFIEAVNKDIIKI